VKLTGLIAGMKENRDKHRLLVGNLEGKRQLGRPRCKYVENIKRDLRYIKWNNMYGLIWFKIETIGEPLGTRS
jgi:hypothetical protein